MKHWLLPISLFALLQGCATQLDLRALVQHGGPDAPAMRQALLFQNHSVAPEGDTVVLSPEDLRPGDIILTSSPTFVSVSIQLVTLAPVSHAAIYIGDGKVVEALRSGVQIRLIDELLAEEAVALPEGLLLSKVMPAGDDGKLI